MAFRRRATRKPAKRRSSFRRSASTARRAPRAAKAQVIKIMIEQPQPQASLPFAPNLPERVGAIAATTPRRNRF